ncbi:MAG: hypothetical protein JXA42_00985, partial [Anaerolineales bacterium]|nr:hypothetical protein [Anaerolineales bacterium]
ILLINQNCKIEMNRIRKKSKKYPGRLTSRRRIKPIKTAGLLIVFSLEPSRRQRRMREGNPNPTQPLAGLLPQHQW